jgi:hypothetical protein
LLVECTSFDSATATAHTAKQVEDLQSTNGLLHNGIRASEAFLNDGDTITFGGAKSAAFNQPPQPTATKSIYVYSCHRPCVPNLKAEADAGAEAEAESVKHAEMGEGNGQGEKRKARARSAQAAGSRGTKAARVASEDGLGSGRGGGGKRAAAALEREALTSTGCAGRVGEQATAEDAEGGGLGMPSKSCSSKGTGTHSEKSLLEKSLLHCTCSTLASQQLYTDTRQDSLHARLTFVPTALAFVTNL